jgi:glutamate-1-semialdehyde 2,1-aminomutase
MAAGIATIRELKENPPYDRLAQLTRTLCEGLDSAVRDSGLPFQLKSLGSMWTLFFTSEPVVNFASAKKCDTKRFGRFFWAMMDRGVYLPCSQFEAAFLSAAHTEADVASTIAAARDALTAI